jgi:hypothetical protein
MRLNKEGTKILDRIGRIPDEMIPAAIREGRAKYRSVLVLRESVQKIWLSASQESPPSATQGQSTGRPDAHAFIKQVPVGTSEADHVPQASVAPKKKPGPPSAKLDIERALAEMKANNETVCGNQPALVGYIQGFVDLEHYCGDLCQDHWHVCKARDVMYVGIAPYT